MRIIAPTVVKAVHQVMPDYADQLSGPVSADEANHVVQLIAMTGLQTELGMGPLFPQDTDAFARIIARAACGVLGYTGQTSAPAFPVEAGTSQ